MNRNDVTRLAVPFAIAMVLLASLLGQTAPSPVELPGGAPPVPSAAQTRVAFDQALGPGQPGYDRGAAQARVTVLEFADFGCRYCARFAAETWPVLEEEFVRTGRVRWKYVPFVMGMFPNGDGAARAAECAAEQGTAAFARVHDRLYERQADWMSPRDPSAAFRAIAVASGLDAGRFSTCFASAAPGDRIHASNVLADRIGVRATPTFFINGERVEGALPTEQFRAVLEQALRHSGDR